MARRAHELGGLERGDRPRARRVRAARRHRAGPRRDRRDRVRPRRPRRRLAAGRQPRRGPGDRVHLHPLPVPRPARARGHDRPSGAAGRGDRRAHRRGGLHAVQMSTGEVADLDAILAAAEAHDVLTVLDATQAAGWLPLEADRVDFLVAAGYKWLLSPRGTAWMTVAPERLDAIVPSQAGWYAGEDVYEAYIGPPLRLARRRAPPRHLPRLVLVGRRPARAPAAQRDRGRGDPRAQRGAGQPLPGRDGLEPSDSAIVSVDRPVGSSGSRRGHAGRAAGRQAARRFPPLQRRGGRRPRGRRRAGAS